MCSNLVHKIPLGELFVEQFDYADVFNRLCLNDTEIGLVCAIMIFNPGIIPAIIRLFSYSRRRQSREYSDHPPL